VRKLRAREAQRRKVKAERIHRRDRCLRPIGRAYAPVGER
jgi:hypothetical protein